MKKIFSILMFALTMTAFVNGDLLCTRWVDNGQENYGWKISTISGDQMQWKALRQNGNGTTAQQETKCVKVN